MKTSTTIQCAIGDEITVYTASKTVDPNGYKVIRREGKVLVLQNMLTQTESRIHYTRVESIVKQGERMDTTTGTTTQTTDTAPRLDYETILADLGTGSQHFMKEVPFDREGITQHSHCFISGDGAYCIHVNTYNGSPGAKSAKGTRYDVKNLAKKVRDLTEKKNFIKQN